MVHVLRWNFFNTRPNSQESTSDYVNRLVNLAVDCDFEHLSIKGAIMQNLLAHSMSPYLRQVVLDEELSIDQTISWTKKLEEKCQAEIALLKLELKNWNSEELCENVDFISPKMEIHDDQIDDFVNFYQSDGDVNDMGDLINDDQVNDDVHDNELDEDYIHKIDNELQKVVHLTLIKNETPEESNNDETSFVTEVLFSCEHCDYTTKSKHDLKTHVECKHIRSVHYGIQYLCDKCDYKTKDKGNLKKHVKNIHVKEKNYYTCEHCDYTTQKPINIKNHTQSQHEGVLYSCEQCDYKAKYRQSLHRHVLSRHKGVTYPCEQCDYKSSDKGNLKKHVFNIHKGVTYPCDQCDYKSTDKGYLKKHVFNIHVKNKQTKPNK